MTTWNRDDSDLSTLTGIASTTVGNLRLTGSTIGHISDTDILTFSSNALDITASSGLTLKDSDILLKNSGNSTTIQLDASSGNIIAATMSISSQLYIVSGYLNLDDSSKITLGTSADLEIFHDGSHSYIKDVGTGDLKLMSSDSIYLNNGSDDIIKFTLADDSTITTLEGDCNIVADGDFNVDARDAISLDAGNGKIELKDDSVEFGSLNNSSGNLLIKSGTTTALTFSGANSQFSGSVDFGHITVAGDITAEGHITVADTLSIQALTTATSGVKLGNNIIYASDGGSTITLDTSDNVTILGNLTCNISAGDGSSENFVVEQSGLLLKRTATQVRSDLGISDAEIVDWASASAGTIHATNYVDNNTQLTTEQVQDIVGGMFTGNTETRIAATYEDGDGTIDLVADDMTANTMGSGFTVSATTDSNATTITQGDDLMFTAGTGITCTTTADGTVTIANTVSDTNTQTTYVPTWVDSSADALLRLTAGGAGSGTQDLKIVAGTGISITPSGTDMTIANTVSDTNTNQLTTFTVSATTDTTPTTISQGDDLFFAAGTGITCTTTADGTVTIVNTVANTDIDVSVGNLETRLGQIDTNITIGNANTIDTTIAGQLNIGQSAVFTAQTGTDAVSINWSTGNKYHLLLDNSSTVTFATNPSNPCNLLLKIAQGNGGSKAITWAVTSGTIYWAGGGVLNTSDPTLTTTDDKTDILSFYFDGTNYYGVASLDFDTT